MCRDQGASRAAPGKSGLHAHCEGERVNALESWKVYRASRTVKEGLSRCFLGHGSKPWVPSTCASDLRKLLSVPLSHQAPLSMEFSRQEYWSGLPFPSPESLMPLPNWKPFARLAKAETTPGHRFLKGSKLALVVTTSSHGAWHKKDFNKCLGFF